MTRAWNGSLVAVFLRWFTKFFCVWFVGLLQANLNYTIFLWKVRSLIEKVRRVCVESERCERYVLTAALAKQKSQIIVGIIIRAPTLVWIILIKRLPFPALSDSFALSEGAMFRELVSELYRENIDLCWSYLCLEGGFFFFVQQNSWNHPDQSEHSLPFLICVIRIMSRKTAQDLWGSSHTLPLQVGQAADAVLILVGWNGTGMPQSAILTWS